MSAQILIVEDEPLIAIAMCQHLQDEGLEIAGVAPSISRAMALLDETIVDAAILDCNLLGESVEPFATELSRRGIPFMFHSGYGRSDVPPQFRDAPFLSKPARAELLMAAIRQILS